MKILIVNLHSSLNAGDDVLTRVSMDLLQQNFPEAEIMLAMNDPASCPPKAKAVGSFVTWIKPGGSFSIKSILGFGALGISFLLALLYRLFKVKVFSILPDRFQVLLKAYIEADLVVSSAGNFLYSSGRFGIAFLLNIWVIGYALFLGKPVYMMPQTLGPIRHRWEGWLLAFVAKRMRLVFVRDPISMQLLQDVRGWHERCKLVPDVAFLYSGAQRIEAEAFLANFPFRPDAPKLGVTLINWQAQNQRFFRQNAYETAVATAIRTFIHETNGQAILFAQVRGPSQAEDDRIPARRVYAMLAGSGNQVFLVEEENVTADILKAAYGLMDIFIGTRLHSNIFALTSGTPSVMLQYQYKTRGVVEMLGLEAWIIDINEVTESNLTEKLRNLWQQRQMVETEISQSVAEAVKQIEQVGTMIANNYNNLS